MSEPRKIEIEDVLSSIRRLVSQDTRPAVVHTAPEAPSAPDIPDMPDHDVTDETAWAVPGADPWPDPQDDVSADAVAEDAPMLHDHDGGEDEAANAAPDPLLLTPSDMVEDAPDAEATLDEAPMWDMASEDDVAASFMDAEAEDAPGFGRGFGSGDAPDPIVAASGDPVLSDNPYTLAPAVLAPTEANVPAPPQPPFDGPHLAPDEVELDAEWSGIQSRIDTVPEAPAANVSDAGEMAASDTPGLSSGIVGRFGAFGEDDPAFEPEEGDPFGIEAGPGAFAEDAVIDEAAAELEEDAPDVADDLPGQETLAAVETADAPMAEHAADAPAPEAAFDAQDAELVEAPHDAAGIDTDPEAVLPADPMAGPMSDPIADDAAVDMDPDLQHAAWAETVSGSDETAEWPAEDMAEPVAAHGYVDEPRRLHLSDAARKPPHRPRPSTYEDMLDEEILGQEAWEEAAAAALGRNGHEAEPIFNEEALRDLVAQIMREELQGALGEQITRRVRKLVRQEIHRAMMGQDLF